MPVISGLILSILAGMCLLYVVVTRSEVETPKKSTQKMPTKIPENSATKTPTAKYLTDQKDPSYSTPLSEEVTVVLVIAIGVILVIYAWYGYFDVVKQMRVV